MPVPGRERRFTKQPRCAVHGKSIPSVGALKPVIAEFGNQVGRVVSRTTRWHKKQPWLSAKRFGVSPRRKAGALLVLE